MSDEGSSKRYELIPRTRRENTHVIVWWDAEQQTYLIKLIDREHYNISTGNHERVEILYRVTKLQDLVEFVERYAMPLSDEIIYALFNDGGPHDPELIPQEET